MTEPVLDILVIDDDTTDRMAIRRSLSRRTSAVQLHEASTGADAIRIIGERSFACVFLDYRLPDMDGISMLKRLYNADIDDLPAPVIMLTGQGNEGVMVDALRWGAHDYIIKDNISADTIQIALTKAREIYELRKNRRLADDKLRHAQKMDAVGQLTSGIAHDFNNLLSVILGNTHLMRRKLLKLEGAEAAIDIAVPKIDAIELAARRGADLVKHLMVFTRQRELETQVVDLGKQLPETIEMLRRTLGEHIDLVSDISTEPCCTSVDPTQLANAIINISVNARDAMKQGGRLTIRCHPAEVKGASDMPDGGYALMTIEDTGTGMSEIVRQRIFEPFYTTKPAGEGTGLGLSMVYGFIKQSGGHIQVESEEGRGTVFRIWLPLCTATDCNERGDEKNGS